jgi:hypothetical protein
MNGGDQLVQWAMGLVLQPAFEIASLSWPGDHERLACPSRPDHVDELLHPGRMEAHAMAGTPVQHVRPGCRSVLVRVGVGLIEQVE